MTEPAGLPGGRTHMCGALRPEHVGQRVEVAGWVARQRDMGGVVFLDIRDREGLVQVVAHPEETPEAHRVAGDLKMESVIRVRGAVRRRPPGTENPNLGTGDVEIAADDIEVVTEAETPPFLVEDRVEVDETIRLKYRYLDLRRPEMTRVLRLRHRVFNSIRRFFDERAFVDVETPMLTKSTPEGARDFLVPSRLQRGKIYALPQSPQLFKQLLMVAGLDRYYQLVRCFRDEDLRADRHWEFTQLDVEMSFCVEEDVLELIEAMFARVFRETIGTDIPTPFPRLTEEEAMRRYGSDKPDTRYAMELADLTEAFRGSGFRAFAGVVADGGVVKGFAAPGAGAWSRADLDGLVQEAKARGAAGLVWIVFAGSEVRSPVDKHLSTEEIEEIRTATGVGDGDVALLVADRVTRVNVALDGLRRIMADRLGLIPEGLWNFAWITEMPLWEWSEEEQTWVPGHHPFTSPAGDDLQPETAKARAYDITLNGYELGSGSIRIHKPDVQRRIFDMLGLTEEEAQAKFGFLLEAFRYGVPPHGGIALGMDRIVMMMAGHDNIRDVIAFPKTASGSELLTGAPTEPTPEQLRLLGIRFAGD
jgi:aspartyl-tRNA synthetase